METNIVTSQPVAQGGSSPTNADDSRAKTMKTSNSNQPGRRCCCGDNDDWNYPWDKNLPQCCVLSIMWYSLCLVSPCTLCCVRYRDVYCCVQEGNFEDTCVGDCCCGIPRGTSKRRGGKVRHDSDSSVE